MSQETVFRIDAIIGGHSASFKLAAKDAARAATELRNSTVKLAQATARANTEHNKTKDALAKKIVAERNARKETERATHAEAIAADVAKQRQRATRDVLQELRRLAIAERFRARATKESTQADVKAAVAANRAGEAIQNEASSAMEAAVALGTKGKESKKTADRQAELAAVAKIVAEELEHEAEAARHATLMLAAKGFESKRTGREQAKMVTEVARARAALNEERKEARRLNFELQQHRGILASNIRSQPLFAAALASVTAALGPLSSMLGDVTAGAVALGGGIEPLLGNLVLIPSLASTAAQGLGVLGLAFHGVFKTLMSQGKTYQNNLAKLSKPAQDFVKELRGGIIGNAFKELQLQVQTGLFPGLVKGIKSAMGMMKPFSQVAWDTSKAMGHLAEVWGKFVGSKSFGHEFLAIGERNRQTIFRLGEAAKYIVDALGKTLVAAGPFIGHFTHDIESAAHSIDTFVTNRSKNGDLRIFFAEVEQRTKQWLSILGSAVTFFHNIFEAARPLTDVIMNAWVKGAAAASDWAKNNESLKSFFISAQAPLAALGGLVGALASALAELASKNQGNLVILANALSKHVVPALQGVADFFATLIPTISKTLGDVADSLKIILHNSGSLKSVLKEALKAISGIAKAMAFISEKIGTLPMLLFGAAGIGVMRVGLNILRTYVKELRNALFLKAGLDITGKSIVVTKGKGMGRFLPGIGGSPKAIAPSASREAYGEVKSAATAAGIGGATATALGARAAIGAAIRTVGVRVPQLFEAGVTKLPLIAAGAAMVDTVIEGIKRHSIHEGAAAALTNVFTMGLANFKDYGKIDAAGNKMLDTLEARVKDIAARRKLSIPVDFDITKNSLPKKVLTDFVASLESTVSTTKVKTETWASYFTELKTNVGLNMKRISLTTKQGSEDARTAFAANFNTAAASVMKSMEDIGKFTKSGIATVERYLRQALALYGIKGRDATAYVSTYIYRNEHPGSTGTGANEGGANLFKADGGYVGAPGMRGKDKVHAVLGDGEAVLNHHQQKPVETALRNTYGYGLRDLFQKEKRPHYMNVGGFAGGRQWPMLSGDTDFGTTLGNRLEKLAEAVKQRIFVQSGGRTLSEQAALYAKYGPGRAAAPTRNAPHVRGIAADITPNESVFGGAAGKFGLGFPVPGEPWHIQIIDGAGAGSTSARSVSTKLKRVLIKSGGLPGAIGQGAVDTVRGAAQLIVNAAASAGDSSGDGAAPNVSGITGKGHPAQNMSIARGLLRQFGWGMDQWQSLKSLWTGESGWDEWVVNKGSGASGIPQALGHGNVFALGDAKAQILWGLNYIRDNYGSPQNAYSQWLSRSPHWYEMGGIVGDPRLIGTAAARTPPPSIPLSQAPAAPNDQQKSSRAMNPFTKKYETHSRAEWERIREKYAASRKKKLIGPTGRPPIGMKHKYHKTRPKKKTPHGKAFRNALHDVASLQGLPNLISGAEFERVANNFTDEIGVSQKRWDLTDEQQIISGLFDIASNKQVAAMPTYDSKQYELRDVLNWDGGIDAGTLNFVPGINDHVAELNQNLGMEDRVVKYLGFAVDAYKRRMKDASDYMAKYLSEMNELGRLVSFMRERKAAAQKQYDKEQRRHGTWQDRVAWNQDEMSALRKWLSDNGDANTDQAKSYKHQAHGRIQDLEDQNRHLRQTKPAPSKSAKDALRRMDIYGNDLQGLTGKKDPSEPPGDVTKWSATGVVGGVIKTFKGLQTTIGDTALKIGDLTNDDNSGIPAHLYNIDQIKKEIADWTGAHLPAEALSTPGGADNTELNDLLRQQLVGALQSVNLQDMQMSVFQGLAPYIGRFQHGGWVPQTGLAMLERGEYVVPEQDGPNPIYNMQQAPSPVNVTLVLDGHAAHLVKLVDSRIDTKAPLVVSQQLGRKGRAIANAPGRG